MQVNTDKLRMSQTVLPNRASQVRRGTKDKSELLAKVSTLPSIALPSLNEQKVNLPHRFDSVIMHARNDAIARSLEKNLFQKGIKELEIEFNAKKVIQNFLELEHSPKVISKNDVPGMVFKEMSSRHSSESRSPPKKIEEEIKEVVKEKVRKATVQFEEKKKEAQPDLDKREQGKKESNVLKDLKDAAGKMAINLNEPVNKNIIANEPLRMDQPCSILKEDTSEPIVLTNQPISLAPKRDKFSYTKTEEPYNLFTEKLSLKRPEAHSVARYSNLTKEQLLKMTSKKEEPADMIRDLKNRRLDEGGLADISASTDSKEFAHAIDSKVYHPKKVRRWSQDQDYSFSDAGAKKGSVEVHRLGRQEPEQEQEDYQYRELQRKIFNTKFNPTNKDIPIDLVANERLIGYHKESSEDNREGKKTFSSVYERCSQRISNFILKNSISDGMCKTVRYSSKPNPFNLPEKPSETADSMISTEEKRISTIQDLPVKLPLAKTPQKIITYDPHERGGVIDLNPVPTKAKKRMTNLMEKPFIPEVEYSVDTIKRNEYNKKLATMRFSLIKEMYKQPTPLVTEMTLRIQRAWRKVFQKKSKNATMIQKVVHGYFVRKVVKELRSTYNKLNLKLSFLENLMRRKILGDPLTWKLMRLFRADKRKQPIPARPPRKIPKAGDADNSSFTKKISTCNLGVLFFLQRALRRRLKLLRDRNKSTGPLSAKPDKKPITRPLIIAPAKFNKSYKGAKEHVLSVVRPIVYNNATLVPKPNFSVVRDSWENIRYTPPAYVKDNQIKRDGIEEEVVDVNDVKEPDLVLSYTDQSRDDVLNKQNIVPCSITKNVVDPKYLRQLTLTAMQKPIPLPNANITKISLKGENSQSTKPLIGKASITKTMYYYLGTNILKIQFMWRKFIRKTSRTRQIIPTSHLFTKKVRSKEVRKKNNVLTPQNFNKNINNTFALYCIIKLQRKARANQIKDFMRRNDQIEIPNQNQNQNDLKIIENNTLSYQPKTIPKKILEPVSTIQDNYLTSEKIPEYIPKKNLEPVSTIQNNYLSPEKRPESIPKKNLEPVLTIQNNYLSPEKIPEEKDPEMENVEEVKVKEPERENVEGRKIFVIPILKSRTTVRNENTKNETEVMQSKSLKDTAAGKRDSKLTQKEPEVKKIRKKPTDLMCLPCKYNISRKYTNIKKILLLQSHLKPFLKRLISMKKNFIKKDSEQTGIFFATKQVKPNYADKQASTITNLLKIAIFKKRDCKNAIKHVTPRIIITPIAKFTKEREVTNLEKLKYIQKYSKGFLLRKKQRALSQILIPLSKPQNIQTVKDHKPEMKAMFKGKLLKPHRFSKDRYKAKLSPIIFLQRYAKNFLLRLNQRKINKVLYPLSKPPVEKPKEIQEQEKEISNTFISKIRNANMKRVLDKMRLAASEFRDSQADSYDPSMLKKTKKFDCSTPSSLLLLDPPDFRESKRLFYLHYLTPKVVNGLNREILTQKKKFLDHILENDKEIKPDISPFLHTVRSKITQTTQRFIFNKLREQDEIKKIPIMAKRRCKEMFNKDRVKCIKNKLKEAHRRLRLIDLLFYVKQKVTKNSQEFPFYRLLDRHRLNSMVEPSPTSPPSIDKYAKESYYYRTLKRHLMLVSLPLMQETDAKDKEPVANHLASMFPNKRYRNVYSQKWYLPEEKLKDEKALYGTNLFMNQNDPKLTDYIEYTIRKEKSIIGVKDLIRERLSRVKNLNNTSIFGLMKYSDQLGKEIEKNILCKTCYCKRNEDENEGCHCKCHQGGPENEEIKIIDEEVKDLDNSPSVQSMISSVAAAKNEEDEDEESKGRMIKLIITKKDTVEDEDNLDILSTLKVKKINPRKEKKMDLLIKKVMNEQDQKRKIVEEKKSKMMEEQKKKQEIQRKMTWNKDRQKKLQEEQERAKNEKVNTENERIQKLLEEAQEKEIMERRSEQLKNQGVRTSTPKQLNIAQSLLRKSIGNVQKTITVREVNADESKVFMAKREYSLTKKESKKNNFK